MMMKEKGVGGDGKNVFESVIIKNKKSNSRVHLSLLYKKIGKYFCTLRVKILAQSVNSRSLLGFILITRRKRKRKIKNLLRESQKSYLFSAQEKKKVS